MTKPPYQPLNSSRLASVKEPDDWSNYIDAVDNAPATDGGIGFVLSDKWGGIDLDNCLDEEDELKAWARPIIDLAEGHYIDRSPSGNGLHILGYVNGGKIVGTRINLGDGHVELYRKSPRYFTITGRQYGKCKEIGNIDNLIDQVLKMKPSAPVSLKGAVKESGDRTRSGQLHAQVMHLMKAGKSDAAIFKKLQPEWGSYKGDDWLRTDIERQREKFGIEEKIEDTRYKSESGFLRNFVPPDYLIDGLIQRRFIYSFTGKTGSGKSAVMLRLTAMVGRDGGKLMLGEHEIEKGRVIYFAGENPDDIRIRWRAMLEVMGLEIGETDVHFFDGTTDIAENIKILKEAAARLEPDLIIIDTARAYFRGDDENSNVQMGNYARLLRQFTETGACVIVNCHPTKNAPLDNLQPVGGGAFVAEVDGNLTCIREDTMVHVHWQTKFRGPEFAPIQFELKEVQGPLKDKKGRKIKSVIATPMTEAKVEARMARNNNDVSAVLEIMMSSEYPKKGKSTIAIAEAIGWRSDTGLPAKTRVYRVLRNLLAEKYVRKPVGCHYILTRPGRSHALRLRPANTTE